jgi:transposase-like protein
MKSELNAAHYIDEEAAFAFVEAHLWPNGPVCPHCGTLGEASRSKGKTTRAGLWNCRACRKPFTVRMGTVFESSHVPLHIWLQVIYLICSSKKGISTRQVHRTIGGSLKTAWFLTHRVRAMMAPHSDVFSPMGGAGKTLEVDETFIGKKADAPPNPWQITNERGWHRARNIRSGDKLAVVALVERGGEARSFVADDTTAHELRKIILAQADAR